MVMFTSRRGRTLGSSNTRRWFSNTYRRSRGSLGGMVSSAWMASDWEIILEFPLIRIFSMHCELMTLGGTAWIPLRVWVWESLTKHIYNSLKSMVTGPKAFNHSTLSTIKHPSMSKTNMWVLRCNPPSVIWHFQCDLHISSNHHRQWELESC